jgi:transposase
VSAYRDLGLSAVKGPPLLRWALYEAGMCASRPTSPDHAYFTRSRTGWGRNAPRSR